MGWRNALIEIIKKMKKTGAFPVAGKTVENGRLFQGATNINNCI
jgi:hypothetical protein